MLVRKDKPATKGVYNRGGKAPRSHPAPGTPGKVSPVGKQKESRNHSRKKEQTDTRQMPQSLRGLETAAQVPPDSPPAGPATQNSFHPVTARELQPPAQGYSVITKRAAFMRISKGPSHILQNQTTKEPHTPTSFPTHRPPNRHFILSLSCH